MLLIMTGTPLRCHPWHLSANANIVFALPLWLNHFPRKSHSLRRIYVRGSSPFLLCYERKLEGFSKRRMPAVNGMSFRGCLSEGVDIFLKSVEHQGESGHDVRVSRLTPWMARVGGPVMMKTAVSLFNRKFTPGDATSRRDVPFVAGVRSFLTNSQFTILFSTPGLCLRFLSQQTCLP